MYEKSAHRINNLILNTHLALKEMGSHQLIIIDN